MSKLLLLLSDEANSVMEEERKCYKPQDLAPTQSKHPRKRIKLEESLFHDNVNDDIIFHYICILYLNGRLNFAPFINSR